MTNKEAELIAYELSGVAEHRGHPAEIVGYVQGMIVKIRKDHPKINDHMIEFELDFAMKELQGEKV